MTARSLAKLRSLANGNGLDPKKIVLVETKEQTYDVKGLLTLTPQSEVTSKQSLGRVRGAKGIKVFSSFAEMNAYAKSLQEDFSKNASWYDQALKELEKTTGHGWGMNASHLSWSDQTIHVAATENCPSCRGAAQQPCPECKGIALLHCHHCEGRGEELCIQCAGVGLDPANPQIKCPICHGTRFSTCRFCQGRGKIACTRCQGRGNLPCRDCNGTGVISQEIFIEHGARMDFVLRETAGLPSGLLRGLSRLPEDKLAKGHADIEMLPNPDDKDKKDLQSANIPLIAHIPFADMKIKFGDKGSLISCFGKRGVMINVPPFLDHTLESGIKALAAATRDGSLNKAMKFRAIADALDLSLQGKHHPNALRQLYPVGLSANAAQAIMKNIQGALKQYTVHTRRVIAFLCWLACAGIIYQLFLTPFFIQLTSGMNTIHTIASLISVPSLMILGTWFILSFSTKFLLQNKFPGKRVSSIQKMGKTGIGVIAAILLTYLAALFFTGWIPDPRGWF